MRMSKLLNISEQLDAWCKYSQHPNFSSANASEFAVGMLHAWFQLFNQTSISQFGAVNTTETLEIALFLANQAWLTQTTTATWRSSARTIYSNQGTPILKPWMSTTSVVVISALITLQIIGLCWLVRYIYRVPTWTTQLDSLAVINLVQNIERSDMLPLGSAANAQFQKLRHKDGLVGLAKTHSPSVPDSTQRPISDIKGGEETSRDITERAKWTPWGTRLTDSHSAQLNESWQEGRSTASEDHVQLARGGPGIISKRTIS